MKKKNETRSDLERLKFEVAQEMGIGNRSGQNQKNKKKNKKS